MGEAKRRKLKDPSWGKIDATIFHPDEPDYEHQKSRLKELNIFPENLFESKVHFGSHKKEDTFIFFVADPIIEKSENRNGKIEVSCRNKMYVFSSSGIIPKWFNSRAVSDLINKKIAENEYQYHSRLLA